MPRPSESVASAGDLPPVTLGAPYRPDGCDPSGATRRVEYSTDQGESWHDATGPLERGQLGDLSGSLLRLSLVVDDGRVVPLPG